MEFGLIARRYSSTTIATVRHARLAVVVAGLVVACGCEQKRPVLTDDSEQSGSVDSDLVAPKNLLSSIEIGGIALQRIAAGEFVMGAVPGDDVSQYTIGEHPRHRVAISRDFYLSRFETTVGQFREFVDATDYQTEVERSGLGANSLNHETGEVQQLPTTTWRSPGFAQTDDHPVICVSWYDAIAFCEWLSTTHQRRFRLPTEAEWEYSCRAGSDTRYSTGDNPMSLQGHANVGDQTLLKNFSLAGGTAPWSDGFAYTAEVGKFLANNFGVYDMHGNVGEWCQDWYSSDFYQQSPTVDPNGPATPTMWHSVRGGSWYNAAFSCRSSGRHDAIETAPSTTNGFRVLLEL